MTQSTDTGEHEAGLQAIPASSERPETVMTPQGEETQGFMVALQEAAVQLGSRTIWSQATLRVTPGEFIAILDRKSVV